jgi:hypothetical protein
MLCLTSRNMIDKTMCEILWRNISDFYVNLIKQMNKYNIDLFYMHLFTMRSQCVLNQLSKLIILVQDQNSSLKLPVGVSPLQLVNLHRNRRYFVIKFHTWFCLSYFLKSNIKLYCIYQYLMSINSFFNTLSVFRYNHPITVTRDPLEHVLPVFS